MKCPKCGVNVEDGRRTCPGCQTEVTAEDPADALETAALAPGEEPAPVADEPPAYHDTWAVVVEIQKYKAGRAVSHAAADVVRFMDVLRVLDVPEQHVTRLTDEEAAMAHLVRFFTAVLPLKVKPRDRLLLFYVGEVLDASHETAKDRHWLVPWDVPDLRSSDHCIEFQHVFQWLQETGALHSFVLLDAACSSFPATPVSEEDGVAPLGDRACEVLIAADAGQPVATCGKCSLFMEMVYRRIRAKIPLLPDGRALTGLRLGPYVCEKVSEMTKNLQTPRFQRVSGTGDCLFIPCRAATPPVAKPAAPAAPAGKKILLSSDPPDATVLLDHRDCGTTPVELDVPRGVYELKMTVPGYLPFHGKLKYDGVKSFSYKVRLEPRPDNLLPEGITIVGDRYDSITKFPLRVRRERDGAEMVYVPGGLFLMGSTKGDEDEKPSHSVKLAAFYIDRDPITNEQYEEYIRACSSHAPKFWRDPHFNASHQPVVGIRWKDAARYAEWIAATLPTEAQWEKAAGGTKEWTYPWGNIEPTADIARFEGSSPTPGPVVVDRFSRNVSACGARQMCGNVWEWCADWYDAAYYLMSMPDEPHGPESGTERVARGGAWDSPLRLLRITARAHFEPDLRARNMGFRCVLRITGG